MFETALELPLISDYHAHLRQDAATQTICWLTRQGLGRIQAMPNLNPPILTGKDAEIYHEEIKQSMPDVDVFVTLKLTPKSTPEGLEEAFVSHPDRILACKLYPSGATTNSSDGIPIDALRRPNANKWLGKLLATLEKHDRVLCLHGEMPDVQNPLTREIEFLDFLGWVVDTFPKLRVVLEHITTKEAVNYIESAPPRVAATITLHHLWCHIGHLTGCAPLYNEEPDAKLHPHLFCWPILKQPQDRSELIRAVMNGDPHFFFGSDSAPHPRSKKEASCGCAGIFSGPVLPEALVTLFEWFDRLSYLPNFIAYNGDRFYRQPRQRRKMRLKKEPWKVECAETDYEPFLNGCTLPWRSEYRA